MWDFLSWAFQALKMFPKFLFEDVRFILHVCDQSNIVSLY